MKKTNNTPHSNFWFGFAVGMTSVATLAYFLSTPKGREMLHKLIEYADDYQHAPEELTNIIPVVKELMRQEELKAEQSSIALPPEKHNESKLSQLIEKMKHVSHSDNNHKKKFYIKENKSGDLQSNS